MIPVPATPPTTRPRPRAGRDCFARRGMKCAATSVLAMSVGAGALWASAQQGPVSGEAARAAPIASVAPGVDSILIDGQLQALRVRLVSIDQGAVVYLDDTGRRVQTQASGLAAMVVAPASAPVQQGVGAAPARSELTAERARKRLEAQSRGTLETTDGQRYPGEPAPTSGPDEAIVWAHPVFGQITIPLDRVAAMVKSGTPGPGGTPSGAIGALVVPGAAPPVQDELLLVNGDRLKGLILDLGDPVRIETDEQKVVELPADRIAGAVLSNPRARMSGVMVWLDDGTVAEIDRLSPASDDRVALRLPGGQSGEYEIGAVRAVAFEFGRLVALSSIEPLVQEAVGGRLRVRPMERLHHPSDVGVGAAVTLGAWDLEFPGPMRVQWRLPENAQRLATTAVLDPESAPWGDCELVVAVDGQEVWRRRMFPDEPVHAINLPLGGRNLTVTVEPGTYGAVKDRVILRRPLVLLRP